jgi:acyl-CoA oxidase
LKEHPYFNRLIKPLLERRDDVMDDPGNVMGLDDELKEMKDDRKTAEEKFRRED